MVALLRYARTAERVRWTRPAAVLGALVLAAGVSACGEPAKTAPQPTPVTTTATADPFAAKNRTPDPDAMTIVLTKISLAATPSGDQVIFEFSGSAVPGWAVHYVTEAIRNADAAPDSKPTVLPIAGQSIIEVLIREAAGPFRSTQTYTGPETLTDPAMKLVTEVRYATTGRGITQAFIGLGSQVGFQVQALTGPPRVVVQIDHR
ncbi:hypothetical protein H0264_19840 [Nocardia huaxiensis]|uniref:AMIN-like domain-containing protein n=1 Tax=Nocardia huaxiensis TaxID=2755382 RepID=A0A7D6ZDU8_9NOCA|nr:hypothetical protein [Nocardia huaxiensis]QLY27720.1 hypothetical protein H0264_19840 [Nocardia huaxiensis]